MGHIKWMMECLPNYYWSSEKKQLSINAKYFYFFYLNVLILSVLNII